MSELTRLTRFLSQDEREAMNEAAIKQGFYRDDRRVFTPGMGWFQPWYFDPTGQREHVMIKLADRGQLGFLSTHYWQDWSHIRPPMVLVCPNGEQWEVDRKSSNGDGWKVTGEWPFITCTPSIVVNGYHGFLTNGEFTADLDGRGPVGQVLRD